MAKLKTNKISRREFLRLQQKRRRGTQSKCYAIKLDGTGTFIQSEYGMIDPDGDNTIEFWTPEALVGTQMIVTQTNQATSGSSEFRLFTSGSQLRIVRGGTETALVSSGLNPFTRYTLTQVENNITVTQGVAVVANVTAVSGPAREPSAPTRIGARSSGGSMVNFFEGFFPDFRVNSDYYPLNSHNQAVQVAQPSNDNDLTILNFTDSQWEVVPCHLKQAPATVLLDETVLNDNTLLY
jgi:hypothetical protein